MPADRPNGISLLYVRHPNPRKEKLPPPVENSISHRNSYFDTSPRSRDSNPMPPPPAPDASPLAILSMGFSYWIPLLSYFLCGCLTYRCCVGLMGSLSGCPAQSDSREGWGLGFPCCSLTVVGKVFRSGPFPFLLPGQSVAREAYVKKTARPQGRATHQSRNLAKPLKFHSPKLRRRMHQL
jgi:hypothetical protein